MDIFKGQNLLEFSDRFKTDADCKEYLSFIKSKTAYKCLKCDHSRCQSLKDFGRQCNICGPTESATANTLFHKVKFGVRKAFFICFEMATSTTVTFFPSNGNKQDLPIGSGILATRIAF